MSNRQLPGVTAASVTAFAPVCARRAPSNPVTALSLSLSSQKYGSSTAGTQRSAGAGGPSDKRLRGYFSEIVNVYAAALVTLWRLRVVLLGCAAALFSTIPNPSRGCAGRLASTEGA
jgi:hypothetical protein